MPPVQWWADPRLANPGTSRSPPHPSRPSHLTSRPTLLLPSQWVTNGNIPVENFRKLVEFTAFLSVLSPAERKVASSLTYEPTQSLLEYSLKTGTCLADSPARALPSEEKIVVAPVVTQKPRSKCTFCGKFGHEVKKCFRRKNQTQRDSNPEVQTQDSSSPSQQPSDGTRRVPWWCAIHGNCGHVTEKCRTIIRQREQY